MCGPVQQMNIQPKKLKSFSEMKQHCNKCPLHLQPEDKEVHLQFDDENS